MTYNLERREYLKFFFDEPGGAVDPTVLKKYNENKDTVFTKPLKKQKQRERKKRDALRALNYNKLWILSIKKHRRA